MWFKLDNPLKIAFLLCGFILCFFCVSAQNEDKILLKGFTLNHEHLQVVPLASIKIAGSKERYISNRIGFFKLYVFKTDTLQITAIGFSTLLIPVQNIVRKGLSDSIIILMESIDYQLKEVNVIEPNLKRDSIAKLVAKILSADSLLNNYDRIYKRPKGNITLNMNYTQPGIIYRGPITDLYNKFSKEGKENVRFEEFVKYSDKLRRFDLKYNKQVVKSIVDIDNLYLDDFLLFCKPNIDFVINANNYDLQAFIKECAYNFKLQKLKDKDK